MADTTQAAGDRLRRIAGLVADLIDEGSDLPQPHGIELHWPDNTAVIDVATDQDVLLWAKAHLVQPKVEEGIEQNTVCAGLLLKLDDGVQVVIYGVAPCGDPYTHDHDECVEAVRAQASLLGTCATVASGGAS